MSLRFGQVVHYYPNYGTCELVMCDNGQRFQNVTVLNQFISSDTGVRMHHAMMRPPSEEESGGLFDQVETAGPDFRTIIAACVMTGGRPMVLGFMPHHFTQMQFIRDEQNRDIYRHPAGNNINTERHGNYEVHHTGGAFIKIGKDVVNSAGVEVLADYHEDLTPLCANENWLYPLNDPVTITVVTGDQAAEAIKIRIRPSGDVDWMGSGYLHVRHARDLHVDIGEHAQIHVLDYSTHTAGGDIKIRTPANVTVTAGGSATVQAAESAHVYAGGDADVVAVGEAVVAAGLNVKVEAVGEVQVGSAGPVTIASALSILMAAPVIVALTETFIVTGSIVEGGPIAGIVGAGVAEGMAAVLAADAAARAALVPVSLAPELAAAAEDLAEAALEIELAVEEAVETSLEAVGTGVPDNEGLTSDPAPDVP